MISYSGSDRTGRLVNSTAIAYGKLVLPETVKNGIFYFFDVLFVYANT
jgi:hypothetical protein